MSVPKVLKLSAFIVEEQEYPRPHYRVDLRGAVTDMLGNPDPTAGLLPEELVMTVRLSTEIGSDLQVIKNAATKRAIMLLDRLVQAQSDLAGKRS